MKFYWTNDYQLENVRDVVQDNIVDNKSPNLNVDQKLLVKYLWNFQ